jgi:hypothetical protein
MHSRSQDDLKEDSMGFFDKLKASVGVGGATISMEAASLATSSGKLPVVITVKGGNLEQKLNGIEVFMRMSVSEKQADGSTRQISKDLFTTRLATSAVIRPNEAQRYTITLDVPPLQLLYADSQDFLQFVLNDQPEFQWKAEGPLPFTGFSFPDVTIGCSADIPGAIDPSTSQVLIIVPEAAGELTPVRVDAVDEIEAIANAYSCQCINQGDQWLVWWSAGDSRVVGWGKLKAIVSMRGEELVRTHTNPHVPRLSVLPRQAGETADTMPGGAEEALALAHQLSRDAGMTAMTRPIGNAFFAVEDLRVVAQA